MSVFGQMLFSLCRLFFGHYKVRPRDKGAQIIRAIFRFRKISDDGIDEEIYGVLRNEAFRRASLRSQAVLWRDYLAALFEVGNAAADHLKGFQLEDSCIVQICQTMKVSPARREPTRQP